MEWDGLPGYQCLQLSVEIVEYCVICGYGAGLIAVAAGKVLRHDHGDFPAVVRYKE